MGPADGSNSWSEHVLAEFYQLIADGQRLIQIHNDTSIPLLFTDIYEDIAAYEDHQSWSFSTRLMAKGLVQKTTNAHIVSWYNVEAVHPVDSDVTASLSQMDVHKFQMPAVHFGSATASQPSQSYVVANVTVDPPPLVRTAAIASNKKQPVSQEPPPKTTADIHRQKMERVDKWLEHGSHRNWKPTSFKMCVDDPTVAVHEAFSRLVNHRVKVKDCQREGRPDEGCSGDQCEPGGKKSGCTGVPLQSSFMSFSNLQQQQPSRRQFETCDTPERDVNQVDQSTRPSGKNRSFEQFMNQLQGGGDGSPLKYFASTSSTSTPKSLTSKTCDSHVACDSVREGQRRPLFTLDENISSSSKLPVCIPEENKMDCSTVRNTFTSKRADDTNFHGSFSEFVSEILPSTDAEKSPLVDTLQTKSDPTVVKSPDEESVASKQSSGTPTPLKKAAVDEAIAYSSSGDQGGASWMEGCTPADEPPSPTQTIPPFSLLPAVEVEDLFSDHNANDEDARSETSSMFVMAKVHPLESDLYLTANETSSSISATSPKKNATTVSSAVSHAEQSTEVSNGDPMLVLDDETLRNDHAVTAADVMKTLQVLPSVKLEIPESHHLTVFLSSVESPHRFWVNLGSEEIAQLDCVTELLNTLDLVPTDLLSSSIELHQCYAVRSADDGLYYRAEVVEVCYGDACCMRGSSDSCESCQCDQMMHLPTDTVSAVRVRTSLFTAQF